MAEDRYQFGSFVLDTGTGRLSRDGQPLPVGQRGIALLAALLEAQGEPVSKDDLLAKGWPGLIVEEANLSVQIATLRKTLGQNEAGADWIATVPRFGYRFLRQIASKPVASEPLRPVLGVLLSEGLADAGSGYFAHGVVDGIVAALSRFKEFAVVAPQITSLGQDGASSQQIAANLGVRYLLRCTAQRAGDRFRVTVHLLDGLSAMELWAKRFDGTISEVFDFEDRIAESVAGLVGPAISRAEIERARRKRPDNLDAYDLYLRALPLFRTIDPVARSEAIRLLDECVSLDPHFAAGLAQAAWAYERQETFGTGMSETERLRALALANAAAEEGHDDPQVMAISALILILAGGERQRGLAMVNDAYAANPNNAVVMPLYAFCNVFVGDLELGLQTFMRALEVSPAALMTYEYLEGLSLAHLLKRDFESAAQWALRSIAVNGQWPAAWWNLASAYGHLGRKAEAEDAVRRLLVVAPTHRLSHFERIKWRYESRYSVFIEGLRKAGLPP
jgi:DNA-binding winged helix-turn-helix (wHTH) protein/tetratricopeptide (TPR) repeat protein